MDWDPVIVRGKIDKTREKEKYVKFMGQEIKLPKRSQYSGISPEQKLEEAELCGTHRKVSKETGLTIQRARVAKQYTQKDLAGLYTYQQIYLSYELGKSIPDPNVMQKLRRVLGVKL